MHKYKILLAKEEKQVILAVIKKSLNRLFCVIVFFFFIPLSKSKSKNPLTVGTQLSNDAEISAVGLSEIL